MKGNKVNNQDINVNVEVTGSLAASLAALGKRASKDVMVRAAKAGAEITARSIDSRIPAETGELKGALALEITTNKNAVIATVGFDDSFMASVAYWTEHGHATREAKTVMQRFFKKKGTLTGHVPAHPFFRPGIDAAAKASAEAVMTEIYKALQSDTGEEKKEAAA
jgi:hypothetical protein